MSSTNTEHSADLVPADAPEPGPDWNTPQPEKLPAPTAWPFVLAFGICMLAWGVVTSWVISLIGGLITATAVGGWIQRMREEQNHD